ncbi:MAG: hypothetical protein WAQ28_13865 [Bacteroidia bacterium]|jgi:phage host-nuclease inhibitor protein Gam
MKKLAFITMAVVAAGTAFTSCDSTTDKTADRKDGVVIETAENVEHKKVDYTEDYNTFKRDNEARIDENERKIDALEDEMKREKKEVKAEYKEKISALREKNRELKRRMDDYKTEDNDNERWESFKREFNHDADEVGTSVRDLGKDNKN